MTKKGLLFSILSFVILFQQVLYAQKPREIQVENQPPDFSNTTTVIFIIVIPIILIGGYFLLRKKK